MLVKRLENYFLEAKKHIDLMQEAMDIIKPKMPIKEYDKLSQIERFALNVLNI